MSGLPWSLVAWRALVLVPAVYATCLAALALPGFPQALQSGRLLPYLADKPLGEDGFYMLTVAWNLAAEGELNYNGGLRTTGVQPLATLLYAGWAELTQLAGGDREDFLRLVIASQGLLMTLWSLTVGALCVQARRSAAAAHGEDLRALDFAVLPALAYPAFRWFTYGLETGLYLLLMTGLLWFLLRHRDRLGRHWLALGVLAGLSCLARVDFALILLLMLLLAWAGRWHAPAPLLPAALVVALLLSPWLYWCYVVTGQPWPSSAEAQGGLPGAEQLLARIGRASSALLEQALPWLGAAGRPPLALASVLVLALGLTAAWRGGRLPALKAVFAPWPLRCFAGAWLILTLIYVSTIWAAHFYARYFIPLSLLAYLAVAAMVRGRQELRLLAALALALFFAQNLLAFHSGRVGNTHAIAAGRLPQHFGPGQQVGAFQSGVIGFFNANVMNLDGKLDHRALQALAGGRLVAYMESMNLAAVCDWPRYAGQDFSATPYARHVFDLTPYHVCHER